VFALHDGRTMVLLPPPRINKESVEGGYGSEHRRHGRYALPLLDADEPGEGASAGARAPPCEALRAARIDYRGVTMPGLMSPLMRTQVHRFQFRVSGEPWA